MSYCEWIGYWIVNGNIEGGYFLCLVMLVYLFFGKYDF